MNVCNGKQTKIMKPSEQKEAAKIVGGSSRRHVVRVARHLTFFSCVRLPNFGGLALRLMKPRNSSAVWRLFIGSYPLTHVDFDCRTRLNLNLSLLFVFHISSGVAHSVSVLHASTKQVVRCVQWKI